MLSHITFNITLRITSKIKKIVLFSNFNYFPQFPVLYITSIEGKVVFLNFLNNLWAYFIIYQNLDNRSAPYNKYNHN